MAYGPILSHNFLSGIRSNFRDAPPLHSASAGYKSKRKGPRPLPTNPNKKRKQYPIIINKKVVATSSSVHWSQPSGHQPNQHMYTIDATRLSPSEQTKQKHIIAEMDEPNGASSISSPSPVEIDRYFDSSERLPGEIVSTELSRSLENALNLHPSNSETNENTTHPGPKCHDNISDEKHKVLSRIATIKHDGTVLLDLLDNEDATIHFEDAYTQAPYLERIGTVDFQHRPPMQIVIFIVGTRGDVQPFLAIAKRLKELGHRVRLATHANFEQFVLDAGVEFYPLGGDPKVLAEYMVKNKGFLPSHPSEVQNQRNQIKDIVFSMHSACTKRDPVTGAPFKVDAIIANPPAYGHEHMAEALNVPLHVFFTMPWTPTGEFAHPLSRVKHPPGAAGYKVMQLSYYVVDLMIWLGIRDIINDFRKTDLKLESIGFHTVSENALNTPHGYIWSPSLVPKPKDWGPKVDVVGFCFLDLASNYTPPEELVKWLEAGEKPIYFGFGSLPVEEPEKLTETIVEALEARGQRGIINKGWGGLGKLERPRDFVYLLDNVPHDWLFLQCKAVVHHGGAGTTAAGLKAACPTTVVPFFGDQPFWGDMVHARGVGPAPIPIEQFNKEAVIEAIDYMMDPKVKEKANEMAKAMESEDGVTGAVNVFFKHLPSASPSPDHEQESPGIFKRLKDKFHLKPSS